MDETVRCGVVTDINMTIALFWYVTPCGYSYTMMSKVAGFSKTVVPCYQNVRRENSSSVDKNWFRNLFG
jgi:lipoate-protein ligase B